MKGLIWQIVLAWALVFLTATSGYAGESMTSENTSVLSELNTASNEDFTTTTAVSPVCNWKPSQAASAPGTTTAPSTSLQARALLAKPGIVAITPRCRP
ncbi:MAG: hypothetical protein QE263_02925 [Vampirovibrionales bacterium]|nr:hypothetical protein [Vampirovibrionales bacterium]